MQQRLKRKGSKHTAYNPDSDWRGCSTEWISLHDRNCAEQISWRNATRHLLDKKYTTTTRLKGKIREEEAEQIPGHRIISLIEFPDDEIRPDSHFTSAASIAFSSKVFPAIKKKCVVDGGTYSSRGCNIKNSNKFSGVSEEVSSALSHCEGKPWMGSGSDFIFLTSAYDVRRPVISLVASPSHRQRMVRVVVIAELARGRRWR